MPQPGGGGVNSYPPYPVAGSNFPPYPSNNYPGYPPTTGNFSSSPGYPPYNPGGYPPTSGYNSGVSIHFHYIIFLYFFKLLSALESFTCQI